MYRYRICNSTNRCLDALRHLERVGKIRYIKGYRYMGLHGINEAVLVRGDKGSARFNGFLWGYCGQGPRGLVELLEYIGIDRMLAETIAFRTYRRYPVIGEDWRLTSMGLGVWSYKTPIGECTMAMAPLGLAGPVDKEIIADVLGA